MPLPPPKRDSGQTSANTLPTIEVGVDVRVLGALGLTLEAHVHRRVGRVGAVVAHHEHRALRHRADAPAAVAGHRAEAVVLVDLAREGVALLVDGRAVDREPAQVVAADDGVAGHADDPLHEVTARGVEPDLLERLGDRVRRARHVAGAEPAARVLEDHDVAALRPTAAPVGDLLDQDPVVLDQPRLHRLRRDVERLHEERLQHDGQQHRDHQQDQGLLPDRDVRPSGLRAGLDGRCLEPGAGAGVGVLDGHVWSLGRRIRPRGVP